MKVRKVNEYVVSVVEESLARNRLPNALIYEAPTGYGKTSIAPILGQLISDHGYSYGYIHVLPLRSIVFDLYNRLSSNKLSLRNIDIEDIGYQAGGLLVAGKNPFLAKRINVTTIDSLVLNLVKLSLGDPAIFSKHYEASRAMIYTSTITLDEVHLYGGDPGSPEDSLFSTLLATLNLFTHSKTPTIILSATLPTQISEKIYQYASLGDNVVWAKYAPSSGVCVSRAKCIRDKEYDEEVLATKWSTKFVAGDVDEVVNIIKDEYSCGRRVLVIMNKPSRAVSVYRKLVDEGIESTLIHGRLMHGEREEREKAVGESSILVATQVVEAGIDVDFDTLITDIAPPTNLVQRAGRVNRYLDPSREGRVYIVLDESSYKGVYVRDVVDKTIEYLKKYKDKINWRLPYSTTSNIVGYMDLINNVYEGLKLHYLPQKILKIVDLARSIATTTETALRTIYDECIRLEGLVRSSVLVPLIPLDTGESNIDLEDIWRYIVPVSLKWLIDKRDKLFDKKASIIYIVGENIKHDPIGEDIVRDKKKFIKFICHNTVGYPPSNKVFLGIVVAREKYVPGIGLLV